MFSIGFHEFGHFTWARRFGMRVPQFMVGFGPTVWSRRRGETQYGFKAIPLGGYIRIVGMIPPAEEGESKRATRMRSSSPRCVARRSTTSCPPTGAASSTPSPGGSA